MLKQKQAKSVKFGLHLKDLKSSLFGKFINFKLYLLILLSISTGGFFIVNIMVPEQIPPAQAQSLGAVIQIVSHGNARQKVQQIRRGQVVRWVCERGGYGAKNEHIVQFGDHRWRVNYDNPVELVFNQPGRYRYFIDEVAYDIVVSR